MIIENVEQGTDAWKAWREGGIGASEVASVFGDSPFKSAHQLYLDKTGQGKPFAGNAATARGIALEDEARKSFENYNGLFVSCENTCLTHDEHSFIKASLDGWVDNKTILEIKCPLEKSFDSMRDGVPIHYLLQMQQQMLVSAATSCIFFVYHPKFGSYRHIVRECKRTHALIIEKTAAFWGRVEMFSWQSDDVSTLIQELGELKKIEDWHISQRKQTEELLMQKMAGEDLKQASSGRYKITVVTRKVTDRKACALNGRWEYAKIRLDEAKEEMVQIEKGHKKEGTSFIKITAI